MALYYDLPVFKDVYQMTLRIFQVTTNFPREYKFTLGQDLKRDCILLVRYIYRANKTKDKTVYLEQFLDSFEVVKLELRLCKDLLRHFLKDKLLVKLHPKKIYLQSVTAGFPYLGCFIKPDFITINKRVKIILQKNLKCSGCFVKFQSLQKN